MTHIDNVLRFLVKM